MIFVNRMELSCEQGLESIPVNSLFTYVNNVHDLIRTFVDTARSL